MVPDVETDAATPWKNPLAIVVSHVATEPPATIFRPEPAVARVPDAKSVSCAANVEEAAVVEMARQTTMASRRKGDVTEAGTVWAPELPNAAPPVVVP